MNTRIRKVTRLSRFQVHFAQQGEVARGNKAAKYFRSSSQRRDNTELLEKAQVIGVFSKFNNLAVLHMVECASLCDDLLAYRGCRKHWRNARARMLPHSYDFEYYDARFKGNSNPE